MTFGPAGAAQTAGPDAVQFAVPRSSTTQDDSHLAAALADRDRALAQARAKIEQCETQLWNFHVKIERLLKDAVADHDALHASEAANACLRDELIHVLGSISWRVTRPGRQLYARYPRQSRIAIAAARLVWWITSMQFARIVEKIDRRADIRRHEALIAADPMFDEDFYVSQDPSLRSSGLGPLRHYLAFGAHRDLSPHPLFDAAWYARRYGDLGGVPALVHYIASGRAAGNWPNAFFDPGWYGARHPEIASTGEDPLQHYRRVGVANRHDPSELFRSSSYLARNVDVAAAGLDPLEHYIRFGVREGRDISTWEVDFSIGMPVDRAAIECRKRPTATGEAALFVTHSAHGRLKPHMRHYLEALKREGIAVTLIVAADRGFSDDAPWLYDLLDGLYVRENQGWDFACWAHVLRLNRHLYAAPTLYWMNDSLIGPVNQDAFHTIVQRIRDQGAGMVGLTANAERGRHIQSYFLAFKPKALRSFAFQQFVLGVRSFADKDDVINGYEIRLAPLLEAAGIEVAALFEPAQIHNPTIYEWRQLLDEGFAFVKFLAITHDIRHVDKSGWREELHRHGYDVLLVDRLIAEKESDAVTPAGPPAKGQRPKLRNAPPQISFIGPQGFSNGLGVAARGYLAALMHTGLPVNMLPIERSFHIHQRVGPDLPSAECVGPADVALVHLNPASWQHLLSPSQAALVDRAAHRIGLFVWESQVLPAEFADVAPRLSAIWVPSRFCADAFRAGCSLPVRVVPYVVPVRPFVSTSTERARIKQRMGIAADGRVVLFSFDASSYLARKNPLALVHAFERSGLAGSGWRLVLKTKHLDQAGSDGVALTEAVAHCRGALLVDQSFGASAARALLEMADVYASPHASEGFGLTIAEAMALGKPVVASDFGGSTDILDAGSGFPVACTPWALPDVTGAYAKGTVWGRVDEAALTEALLRAAGLTEPERADLAARARQRIDAAFSPAAVAAQMRAGLAEVLAA